MDAVVASILARAGIPRFKAFLRRRNNTNNSEQVVEESNHESEDTQVLDSLAAQLERPCVCLSLDEIKTATQNFDNNYVIGEGGFGKVYKAVINNGSADVAIKRLKANSQQGATEFWTEIKMLSKLRHTNLVGLIGYCEEGPEKILAYEYMCHGTLADHLYKTSNTKIEIITPLTWEQRLKICIGAARGLQHLHAGTNQVVIHRDVKTTNILLDRRLVAKVSDFGLSKATASHSVTHISTCVRGSFGYLDPEYYRNQRLTTKSDVYSFGVVLLEVLFGRPVVDKNLDEERENLVEWAQQCFNEENLAELIDASLRGQTTPPSLESFVELATNCLRQSRKSRPKMAEVLDQLDIILSKAQPERSGGFLPLDGTKTATLTFNYACVKGDGGFCKVNEDFINNGATVVAVKRMKVGAPDFGAEMKVLCKLRHTNLVELIGYWKEGLVMILAYEHMSRGTLADHLYKTSTTETTMSTPLTWEQRLKICIGTTRGLQYLHSGTNRDFIHGDVKTTNILLDEHWTAKISNFGLSEDAASLSVTHPSTGVKRWYLDPGSLRHEILSTACDVYSFGVVLLEVLFGRPAIDNKLDKERQNLVVWAHQCIKEGNLAKVIDASLGGQITPSSLKCFIELVEGCLDAQPVYRPTMAYVLDQLEIALSKAQLDRSYGSLSLDEIKTATRNFDEKYVIGEGGFGKVYKAAIKNNGGADVAIKRLKGHSQQGATEFWTEIKTLSKLRHTNLVELIGYCQEGEEIILAYEYMSRGTLADHLYKKSTTEANMSTSLTLEQRLKICIGVAHGLQHLHSGTNRDFIHQHVKTTNILLDEHWTAKISDFGLSKDAASLSVTHPSTGVKPWYLDPGSLRYEILSTACDVYSFGVVLLEVLFGRPAIDNKLDKERQNLVMWVQRCIKEGNLANVIDASLRGQGTPPCLESFVELTTNCLDPSPKSRPKMADVLDQLDIILSKARDFLPLDGTKTATLTFNYACVKGDGGFCKVNEDFINNGATVVAVKRMKVKCKPGAPDCGAEMKVLSELRHTNLVELISYCEEGLVMILVNEYMSRGTLADHLYKTSTTETTMNTPLTWEKRLKICIDAARGLEYLHSGTNRVFIHQHVKTTNILLDEHWTAKISDFGLLKDAASLSVTHPSTGVKRWYSDPGSLRHEILSTACDVYSFGVVLLEVLFGRPAIDNKLDKERQNLVVWAHQCIKEGNLAKVIDASLGGQITPSSLKFFIELVEGCLDAQPVYRPTMADVLDELEFALSKLSKS